VSDQHRTFSAAFPPGGGRERTEYSLNNEMDGLRTGFIILGKNNSLYRAGKRNKIPGFQMVGGVVPSITQLELSDRWTY